jgi:hypothetical protein
LHLPPRFTVNRLNIGYIDADRNRPLNHLDADDELGVCPRTDQGALDSGQNSSHHTYAASGLERWVWGTPDTTCNHRADAFYIALRNSQWNVPVAHEVHNPGNFKDTKLEFRVYRDLHEHVAREQR